MEDTGPAVRQLATPVRSKGVVTIPRPVREQLHLQEGDSLLVTVEDGRIVLTPAALLPRDQAWFWTPDWQQAEREADQQIAAGRGTNYESGETFLAALRERTAAVAGPVSPPADAPDGDDT